MNQHELQKRLIRYQGEIEQLGFWLSRAKQSLPEDFEGYRRSLQDASGLAERLACGIRDVRVETCFLPRTEVLREAAQTQGIQVEAEEHWYRIFLPGLLPRKKAGSCAFLTGPLDSALADFGKANPIRRLQKAVVCFRHLYSAELPERLVRDHDNIEVKQVLDVIADHFLVDDNGLLCTNLYTSAMGDREGTEVYVMAPEHLGEWLNLHPIKTP